MKTLKIVLFFMALGLEHSQAQVNLVPNPSFEDLNSCPDGVAQVDRANGWFSRCESPDLFNTCDTIVNTWNNNTGVPSNSRGYQLPFHGNGYAGYGYYGSNYREYLSVKLNSSTIQGFKYYVSYNISYTNGHLNQPFEHAANNQGVLFSTDSMPILSPPNYSHINNTSIISDSLNWITISDSFIADSAYNFVTFGNFYDDASTNIIIFNPNGVSPVSYYYIDNICISTDSSYCNTISAIIENDLDEVIIYPNPFVDFIVIKAVGFSNYKILNSLGQILKSSKIPSDNIIVLNELSSGLYYLRLEGTVRSICKALIKL